MSKNNAKEEEAQALIVQARKKLNSSGFFTMFSGSSKEQDAHDLYVRAAICFKMSKNWKGVGDCYMESANLTQSKTERASDLKEAATAYKKVDPNAALTALEQAVSLLTDVGRFREAAKKQMEVAEIYEKQLVDLPKSLEAYNEAAEWFATEGQSSSDERKALIKVATFCGQLEQYDRAIELFEKIGAESADNNLLRFGAKEFFLKAALCHICTQDLLTARRAFDQYGNQCPGFSGSREAKFIDQILTACEEEELEVFVEVVAEYDSMTPLDAWMSTILLRIKTQISDTNVT